MGNATDAVSHRVEAAIAALGLKGNAISYQRIAAGITNLNWLVFDGDRTLFLKLFGEGTQHFIDRPSASDASRIAGELGIGPRQIAYLPDLGAEAFDYLDGYRTMTAQEMLQPGPRGALIAAYRRMHGAGTLGLTRTGLDQLDERLARARACDAPLPDDLNEMLTRCDLARQAILAGGMPMAICHNDSYIANFMIDDAGHVRVIDWEYAANNDPSWDLGMMAMAQTDPDAAEAMVREYLGTPSPAMAARVRLYGPIILISWGLWAAWQTKISTIDFDYAAYSQMLFQYGRAKLGDPAWQASLCRA